MFKIGQQVWIRRFTTAVKETEAGILIYPYASPGCQAVIYDQRMANWIKSFGDKANMDNGILYIDPKKKKTQEIPNEINIQQLPDGEVPI